MKKILIIFVVIASFTFQSKAQDSNIDVREKIQLGLKAGINYSNVYDAEGEDFVADPKFGLAAGAFISIPIGAILGIQPEILYSQKGFEATGVILGQPYEFKRRTNYLDIPLLFSIKPTSFISFVAGPQFSYLLKQSDEFVSDVINLDQETEFDNGNIRKNTLGAVIGLDINIDHIVVSARASWDLQKNVGDGTSTAPRYKNVLYQLTFGYRMY